jgi:hypothetical protein
MSTEYKIYNIKDFIRKTPEGDLDIDKSMKIVREIAATAGFHHDHNLLVDLRKTEPLSNFGDVLLVAAEVAKFQGAFRNKIAVVIPDKPDRIKRAQFFKAALGDVKFQIEYFTEFEKAIDWLSIIKKYPEQSITRRGKGRQHDPEYM